MTNEFQKINIRVSNERGKKTYSFECKDIIVGRSKDATLRIPIHGMSRSHFQITALEDSLMITDLGSSNGTLLNEEKLFPETPQPFEEGDIISVPGIDVSFTVTFIIEKEKTEKSLIGFLFSGKENLGEATTQVKSIKKATPSKTAQEKKEVEFKYEEDQELLDKERGDNMQKELDQEAEGSNIDLDIEFDVDIPDIDTKPPKK